MAEHNVKLTNKDYDSGFTIVELLIVIVVITILAAISIVGYNGVQSQAHDATVKTDMSAVIKSMELTKANLGRYPWSYAEMPVLSISKPAYDTTLHNVLYCVDKVNDKYALSLASKSGQRYIINTGVISETLSQPDSIACDVIGKTWVNDATTAVIHGYNRNTSTWNVSWSWTK